MDRNFRSRHNEAMAEISAKGRKQAKLAEADQHIAAAELLIARQLSLIAELERDGHATEKAHTLLETMRESLQQMQAHRRLIEVEPEGEV